MPTYDFVCTVCGNPFEATRSFAEGTDGVVCPDDGAESVRIFTPPIVLRSSGSGAPPAGLAPPPPSMGHGHSHAPGTAPHSH